MADHTVIVLGRRRPPKVVPPMLLAEQGRTVSFEARGSSVQIKFWRWPFIETEEVIRLEEGGQSFAYHLTKFTDSVDEYLYSVFCDTSGDLAVGGSEPGIIIKRPSASGI